MRILYVEDDMLSRQILELILTRALGFEDVVVFEDSTDFAARYDDLEPAPDLIFLDIHMEPWDGFEVLDYIRSTDSGQQATIIALTASVMNEEIVALKRAGFDGAIAKPIRQEVFPALLQRIIQGDVVWYVS